MILVLDVKAEMAWLRDNRAAAMRAGGEERSAYVRRMCACSDEIGRHHRLALVGFLRHLADCYTGDVWQKRAPVVEVTA